MPENWKIYKLEDALERIIDYRGKTPQKSSSGIPLVTAKVIKDGRINKPEEFIADELYEDWMTRGFPQFNDVVLTTEAPLGEVAQIKTHDKIALAQRVITLRGKKNLIDNTFLKYFLQSPIGQNNLKAKESGSTVTGIKQSELRQVEIYAPEFNEQRRIAEILSALDDKIELNLQMNATLEKIAQAMFKKLNKNSEKVYLKDYIELNPRLVISKGQLVKYVEMSDLSESSASVKNFIFRSFTAGSKFQQFDTLLARITPCLENGKTAFVDFLEDDEIAFGSTEFIVMRGKNVSPYYVYLLSRNENFREFAIKSMIGSSGRQRVQVDMLNNFELSKVENNEMKSFHSTVRPVFQKITQNSIQIKTLTQIRDGLLPKLMSGKIRVNVEQ